jgi:hypothetical protein
MVIIIQQPLFGERITDVAEIDVQIISMRRYLIDAFLVALT